MSLKSLLAGTAIAGVAVPKLACAVVAAANHGCAAAFEDELAQEVSYVVALAESDPPGLVLVRFGRIRREHMTVLRRTAIANVMMTLFANGSDMVEVAQKEVLPWAEANR